jgi:IclR family KDG regulon transcriptional repressor
MWVMLMKDGHAPEGAQAVERVLGILEYVAAQNLPVRLNDIAEHLKLHRNTAYRLARTLVARDYLDIDDGAYVLGPMAVVLGQSNSRDNILLRKSSPYLQEISRTIGEVTNLGLLRSHEVFYLGRWEDTTNHVGVYVRTGQRAPIYASALGKVFLSAMSLSEREECYKRQPLRAYTAHTLTDVADLERAVLTVRELGYAVDLEELSEGVSCIAVPLVIGGETLAAISISCPTIRFTPDSRRRYVDMLLTVSKNIASEFLIDTEIRLSTH